MKKKATSIHALIWGLVLLGSVLTGCRGERVPLTEQIVREFSEYLPQIQVYISRELLLVRESASEEKGVVKSGDGIRIRTEKIVESITIPAFTPGVVVGTSGDTLKVQFEPSEGESARVIPFSLRSAPREDGGTEISVYVFDAGSIEYDGQRYRVAYEEGSVPVTETDDAVFTKGDDAQAPTHYITTRFYPFLMIRPVEELAKLEKKNRVVKGLRVEQTP